jgi:uncharacterized protein (UPF0335 family)
MTTLQASSQSQLRQFIEQIERLDEDRKGLVADIAEKFAEAKALGFDPKVMRKVLALRRKSTTERQEEGAVLDMYLHALDMLDGTPLGAWAIRNVGAEVAA